MKRSTFIAAATAAAIVPLPALAKTPAAVPEASLLEKRILAALGIDGTATLTAISVLTTATRPLWVHYERLADETSYDFRHRVLEAHASDDIRDWTESYRMKPGGRRCELVREVKATEP